MTQDVVTAAMQGRDLAAERVRARVRQNEVAAVLGVNRVLLSFIENEHAPLTPEFAHRYLEAVAYCQAARG